MTANEAAPYAGPMRKLPFKPAKLTTYITPDQMAGLETLADETGAPLTVHVRRALDAYLASQAKPAKKGRRR